MLESKIQKSEGFDFDAYLSARRALVEQKLESFMVDNDPQILWESMRYSVLSGGKRLRAMLTIAAAESIYKLSAIAKENADLDPSELVMPLCAAIEMIHAMSLVA